VEDVHDPIGKKGWPEEKGRDGERTPMQWDSSKNAGFTTAAKSWLWIPESASTVNVVNQRKDPNSILNFYKKLIQIRRSNIAIRDGSYVTVNPDDANVLSFLRKSGNNIVLVALNMSAQPQKMKFDLAPQGVKGTSGKTLLSAPMLPKSVRTNDFTMPPFGVLIADVK
jgi:alpha-glucosidase